MKFRSMYSDKVSEYTDPGSPIKEEFQLRGEELIKIGETSLYNYIQSHKDSVDIHKILERCALMDDYSILNRMPAQFMDVSTMPKSLAEAYVAIKDAEAFFEHMPLEIKQSYDNSFTDFLKDIGSEKFGHVVTDYLESIKEVKEEVVVNGES